MTDLSHLAPFPGAFVWQGISTLNSFLWPNTISLYEQASLVVRSLVFVDFCLPVHALLFPFPLFSSCCFLPRPGRRSSPSPPPGEEKDQFEVWAPVVDTEAPPLESPTLPPTSSPSCCGFARPDEGISASQPVRRVLGGDHAVPLDPGQLETVLEK